MAPLVVVKDFDVFLDCDLDLGIGRRLIAMMMRQLVLQAAPEAFHRCVIVAISLAKHRRFHAKLFEQLAVVMRTILGGFDRSSQHSVVGQVVYIYSELRQVLSSQAFFMAWRSTYSPRHGFLEHSTEIDLCPLGNIVAEAHSYSHSSHAARDCAGR